MQDFYIRKIIQHRVKIDNDKVESGIVHGMIIGHDLMLQLGPLVDFNHQVIQLYGVTGHMKETRGLLGQSDLSNHNMHNVII